MEQNIFFTKYILGFSNIFSFPTIYWTATFFGFSKNLANFYKIWVDHEMHLYASDLPDSGTDRKLTISAIDRCHSRSLTINKSAFLDHFKNTIFSGHHFFLFFHHFSETTISPNIFGNFRIYWEKLNIWRSHSIDSFFDFVLKYFHQTKLDM